MQHIDLRSYRHEFERVASIRRDEERRADNERRREKRADKDDEHSEELIEIAAVMLATNEEVTAFRLELDGYDRATIVALQDNEAALLEAREKLEEMLAKAYVLPDGRRVFKAEDGIHVFDEHGNEISPEQIDPDEIADFYTKWEDYDAEFKAVEALEAERDELIEFQGKVDAARSKLDDGDLTKDELNEMERDLQAAMPLSVRTKTLGVPETEIANVGAEFSQAAAHAPREQDPANELKHVIP